MPHQIGVGRILFIPIEVSAFERSFARRNPKSNKSFRIISKTQYTCFHGTINLLKFTDYLCFDYDLIENLAGYVVQLPKSSKYAQTLKNSVATKETADDRIFLMKEL